MSLPGVGAMGIMLAWRHVARAAIVARLRRRRVGYAEARIAASLPAGAPAPRLLASFDQNGWVVLIFEDIPGVTPAQPWVWAELERVLRALADLAAALTPAPVDAPTVLERFGDSFDGWRQLHHRGDDGLVGLDPWARGHLAELAALEGGWSDAATGVSLVHADRRADNILLTDDRVVVVDWPWACLAAGYFVWQARQPGPPGLPTLRAFQDAQGRASLAWLRIRTGWR